MLLDIFGLSSSRTVPDVAALCGFVIGSFCLNCLVVAVKLHRLLPRLQRAVAGAVCGRRAAGGGASLPALGGPSIVVHEGELEKRASAVTTAAGGAAAAGSVAAARAEVDQLTAELAQARAVLESLRGMGSSGTAGQHDLLHEAAKAAVACGVDGCRIDMAYDREVCRI